MPAGDSRAAPGLAPATRHEFGAFVTGVAATADGRALGFALGDGTVRLVSPADPGMAQSIEAHTGGCLAILPDLTADALLSGGDDGRFCRLTATGDLSVLGSWRGKWLSALSASTKARLRAVAAGREIHLLAADGAIVQTLPHPSTVAGLAFDPSGQRLAAAHYGGVTLWVGYRDGWRSSHLAWKGSHIGVTWSPSGKFIVSSMQESTLHGWRLADRKDMRMAGYPGKVHSMSWAGRGRWLATSGADTAVLWPFKGEDGPMGKPPLTLGMGTEIVTQVAGHPTQPLLAIGYKDGAVLLARIDEGDFVRLVEPGQGAVSALVWTPDGRTLGVGTETGWAALLPLAR